MTEDEMVGWHQRMPSISRCHPMDMSVNKLQEIVKGREAWPAAVHGVAKNRTRLSDWTTTTDSSPGAEELSWSVFLQTVIPMSSMSK